MISTKIETALVSVILVNWNTEKDTLECINSIKRSTHVNIKIIVVDNNSSNLEKLKLYQHSLNFKLIELNENTGFTGGNNAGIKEATKIGSKFMFILNNDTLIEPKCIELLLEPFKKDKSISVTTPIIYHYPNKKLIWSAGTNFNHFLLTPKNSGYQKLEKKKYLENKFLTYSNGCAFLIKSEYINRVNSFTEDYFCNYEDVDLGLKLKKLNVKTFYVPSAIVWHKESVAAGGLENPQYVYYQTRSGLKFRQRWSKNLTQLIIVKLFFFMITAKRALNFILKGNFLGVLAILLGVFDAYFSRLHRRNYKILERKN